jgi:hypothetical protein
VSKKTDQKIIPYQGERNGKRVTHEKQEIEALFTYKTKNYKDWQN